VIQHVIALDLTSHQKERDEILELQEITSFRELFYIPSCIHLQLPTAGITNRTSKYVQFSAILTSQHVLSCAVIVALSLCVFICVTVIVLTACAVLVTVLTGNVTVLSAVHENVVNGLGVIVAVLLTSVVEVVVVVNVTGRAVNVALATSVVMVVVGLPSGPSSLARARASWETPRPRK
jgi:hypothetical protein